jgi:hypothetical protein
MLIWAAIYPLILMSLIGLVSWLSKHETRRQYKPSKTTLFHVLYNYKTKNPSYLYGSYRK